MKTRGALILSSAGALGVLGWACDVITLPPEQRPPVNQCTDPSTCASLFPEAGADATSCKQSACVVESSFLPILVVSSSTLAVNAPGITFGLPTTTPPMTPPCTADAGANLACIWLPPLGLTPGDIHVSPQLATLLWPPGGLRPNVPSSQFTNRQTSLPVVATFHPLRTDPASGSPMLAEQLGLPLTALMVTSAPQNNSLGYPGPTNGTIDVAPQQFFANVPLGFSATDGLSQYLVEVSPVDPYTVFPPFVGKFKLPLTLSIPYVMPGDPDGVPVASTTYTVQTVAGAPSLAGWTAYAVDSHGFRITGKATLTGAPNEQFTLYDATQTTNQTDQRMIIEPPPGVSLPQYISKALAGVLNRQISYPGLPEQVTVSGSVVLESDPARQIAARVVFLADGTTGGSAVATTDLSTPFSKQLSFRVETTTNGSGQYQVTLPPGKYQTYIIPTDPDLALTVASTLQVIAAPPPSVQNGKGLTVESRRHLRGKVVLGDGTPVSGAQIVVEPTADAPLAPDFDPRALPREAFGATDASGQFDVLVDPGTVDISVRPQQGSRYPWVVTTNWKVLTDTTLPKAVVIPPPGDPITARSAGQLADSAGNPLTRTVVRAYGFPPAGPPVVDGGPPSSRGARLVGMTTSDDRGLFELYLTPPDP